MTKSYRPTVSPIPPTLKQTSGACARLGLECQEMRQPLAYSATMGVRGSAVHHAVAAGRPGAAWRRRTPGPYRGRFALLARGNRPLAGVLEGWPWAPRPATDGVRAAPASLRSGRAREFQLNHHIVPVLGVRRVGLLVRPHGPEARLLATRLVAEGLACEGVE